MQTKFEREARHQMEKDLDNKNVMVDKEEGIIEIQSFNGTQIQYIITIK